MEKTYQKKDQYSNISSVRIDVAGKSKTITFENKRRNGVLVYETSDKEIQKGIEASKQYLEGKVICLEGSGEIKVNNVPNAIDAEKQEYAQEYPDVTTFSQAKEILRGEPFRVGPTNSSLKTAEGILAKAAELGISFPNLSD